MYIYIYTDIIYILKLCRDRFRAFISLVAVVVVHVTLVRSFRSWIYNIVQIINKTFARENLYRDGS